MIKVALTNLGKYNEGALVYEWLELPASEDEIQGAMESIGINEEYEEWFITAYETDVEGLTVGEYEDLEALNELAERWNDMHEWDREVAEAVLEHGGYTLEQAMSMADNGSCTFYSGVDSLEDLAQQFFDEGLFGETEAMGNLVNYIDFERLGRDLGFDGYTVTSKGVIRID